MNNLESILEMWKKDSEIDEMNLDEYSRSTAKLHSKYLELYTINRLKSKKLDLDLKVILRDKFMHYNGKLAQEDLDRLGWDYDPLNGLTVLKSDMDKYYDADPVIQAHQQKQIYTEEMVLALILILSMSAIPLTSKVPVIVVFV